VREIELRWFDTDGMSVRHISELHTLRRRADGLCRLDIAVWSPEAERLLAGEFQFHPMAVRDCD
jgi:hypothetical protein